MLITLDEVKELLLIEPTDSSKDAQIGQLITKVQDYIISRCGTNQFRDTRIELFGNTISFSNEAISDSESQFIEANFTDGLDILIEGSLYNDGIHKIKSAEAGTLNIEFSGLIETSFKDEVAGEFIYITRLIFPEAVKSIAVDMVAYKMNLKSAQGLTSESVGKYSASYSAGFPKIITDALNEYRSL